MKHTFLHLLSFHTVQNIMWDSSDGKANSSSVGQRGKLNCASDWVLISAVNCLFHKKSFQGQIQWQRQTQKTVLYSVVLLSECDLKRLGCPQIYSINHAQRHVSKV